MRKKKIKIEDYEDYEDYDTTDQESLFKNIEEYEEVLYEDAESFDSNEENFDIKEENDFDEEFDDDSQDKKHKKDSKKINKIINIIFYVLIILMIMVTIDVISVSRYNSGPFFAIKTAHYKDGGTKVYTGLGYKVIKYNQIQGRRDTVIGSWALKYSVEPTEVDSIDLAIEYKTDTLKAYEKYNTKFLRISGTYQSYNKKNKTLTFGYIDPDGSYTLNIVCKMAKDATIKEYEKDDSITVIGTAYDFKQKDKKNPNTLYINNCFAE